MMSAARCPYPRLVAAFFIFATLLPLYIFSGSRLSYSIFYKPPECLPIALELGSDDSHRAHDDSFHLPLCLARWRNESAAEVLQYVRDYPPMWFASFQNETVCGKPGGSLGLSISSIPAPQHFPHFAIRYFAYISLLHWQDVIFQGQSCLRHFLVNEAARGFWSSLQQNKQTWVVQLLQAVSASGASPSQFLAPENCAKKNHVEVISLPGNHREWFLHGSEAAWLGSLILKDGRDACSRVFQRNTSSGSALQVLVVQRDWARKILNVGDIAKVFRRELGGVGGVGAASSPTAVSVVDYEKMSLEEQVRSTRDADVAISVHGAGITNWAFLRPCSIAIEILPFGLGTPPNSHYFGVLVSRVGALHFSWTEERANSRLAPRAKLDNGKDCGKTINSLPVDLYSAAALCSVDKYCRACARLASVWVNTTTLGATLKKAMADRATCFRTHPLYRQGHL